MILKKNHRVNINRIKKQNQYMCFSLEPLMISTENIDSDANNKRINRFELKKHPSIDSLTSSIRTGTTSSTKSPRYELFNLTQPNESIKEEPLKAKLCRLRKK